MIQLPVTARTGIYCPACEMKSFPAIHDEVGDANLMPAKVAAMMDAGWKGAVNHPGLVKQCAACAAKESA